MVTLILYISPKHLTNTTVNAYSSLNHQSRFITYYLPNVQFDTWDGYKIFPVLNHVLYGWAYGLSSTTKHCKYGYKESMCWKFLWIKFNTSTHDMIEKYDMYGKLQVSSLLWFHNLTAPKQYSLYNFVSTFKILIESHIWFTRKWESI